jgi:hypothetical protein
MTHEQSSHKIALLSNTEGERSNEDQHPANKLGHGTSTENPDRQASRGITPDTHVVRVRENEVSAWWSAAVAVPTCWEVSAILRSGGADMACCFASEPVGSAHQKENRSVTFTAARRRKLHQRLRLLILG